MTEAAPPVQRLNINSLSPEALSQARQTVSAEIEYMSGSETALRKAMGCFEAARIAAEKMAECKEGQQTLIPITSSLYMSGEIIEPQKLVVDIGTGYYVEMSAQRAVDFYKRKVDFVRGPVECIAPSH
ncbi:hypothetical protein M3Y97_00943600 [Aphelenchoides bicaudatus]|nr:hypothetical protein M3Y97_00943600 [Aphelenchoides bicaudatus]